MQGLVIDRAGEDNVGLFGEISKAAELAVRDLGVEDAEVRGGATVGILAGKADAGFSNVWTTGKANGGNDVGGLVGFFFATGDFNGNTIMMSWSAADVSGVNRVGGLIGDSNPEQTSDIVDNWALGNVSGGEEVGGFSGDSFESASNYTRSWSSGAVSGGVTVGGFDSTSSSSPIGYNSIYWNLDTSGEMDSGGGDGVVVQTLAAANFGGDDASAAWDFGDSDISNGDADFPLLKSSSQPWQAVNVARALTRFLALDGATIAAGTTVTTGGIRLDTNGRADDDKTTDGTSVPTCSFENINDEGVLRAQTNYNGVMVDLRLLTGGDEKFVAATAEKTENCEVAIQSGAIEFAATLRLEISAPATAGYSARSLTTDYALQITLAESTLPPVDAFMIDAPSEPVIVAANAGAGVKVLTVTVTGEGNPSFAAKNNGDLQTEGGVSIATIILSKAAMAAFGSDGLILSLTLTVTNDNGDTETAEVRFVSAPRAISQNLRLVVNLNFSAAGADADVLMAGDAGIFVWHVAGDKIYTLGGDNANLFDVDVDTGEVMVGGDALSANETYNFVLQLTGGGETATRAIRVIVGEALAALEIGAIPDTVIVAANARRGDAVLTLSLSGGANARFSSGTSNNFDNTGLGETTTVSLTRAAVAAFNSDGITLDYVVKALADGEAATITARFVSAPLVISPEPRATVLLAANATNGDEVLAAGDSGLVILHNGGGALTYSLQGGDSALFNVNAANGRIGVEAASLPQGLYNLELLLADATRMATLELQVNVIGGAADEAVRIFLEEIESGARQWRGEGVSDDWDGDGTPNPYDWTPTSITIVGLDKAVLVNLNRNNADGSEGNPYPLYNVWQLQAIDGVVVSRFGVESPSSALFGSSRLGLHYRLSANIDATPTDTWSDGFNPIGGAFSGSLDGAGREIRGLYMVFNNDHGGLFYQIGSGATVSRLGLPDVEVLGNGNDRRAAGLAYESNGLVSLVWVTGEVVADDGFAAGLVRSIGTGGQLRESWFVGKVRGKSSTGGLVGYGGGGDVRDSWAVARVEWSGTGSAALGGLVGASESSFSLHNSWSGGVLDTSATENALIGGTGAFANQNYFDRSISSDNIDETRAQFVVETMVTVTDADSTWSTDVWSFGDTDVSDDAADYPFLLGFDEFWPGLQAVAFANFQSENLIVTTLDAKGESPLDMGVSVTLSLGDTNGLAPDGGPTPTRAACEADATEVELNYNNVTVKLQTIGDGLATFTADCEIVIRFADSVTVGYFSVSALIASQETTMSSWSHSFELPTLIEPLPTDTNIVVPADAAAGYEFLTVTLILGDLVQDENGQTPVVGQIAKPPTILTIVGEAIDPDSLIVTTITSTITLSTPTRDSAVDVTQEGLIGKFLLPDGGATKLFANDDEVFAFTVAVTVGDRVWMPDQVVSLRSAPRIRVATPSPLEIALTQGRVGATVLAPGAAGLAIWHNFDAPETYSIVQTASFFDVDIATGLVTIVEELSANTPYEFMLELKDGTFTATREFRFTTDQIEKGKLVVLNTRRPASDEVIVTLGWRPVSGADRYTLSRAAGSETGEYISKYEGAGEAVDECALSGGVVGGNCNALADWLVFTEDDLTLGSVYYYRLDSCGDLGCAESDILSLSVSPPPPPIFDSAPATSPDLELVTLLHGASSPAAIFEWDVLLTSKVVEGRYTVVLSVSVNMDSGVSTTIYDEYDATVTLTNALPYDYRLSRSSQGETGDYIEVHESNPFGNARKLGYFDSDLTLGSVYYYRLSVCNGAGCADPSAVVMLPVNLDPPGLDAPELDVGRFDHGDVLVSQVITLDSGATSVMFSVHSPASLTVTLTWTQVDRSDKYRVFRATLAAETDEAVIRYGDGRIEYRLLKDLDYVEIYEGEGVSIHNDRLAHIDAVSQDAVYYYQVEACDADDDCSDRSNFVRVGAPPRPLSQTPDGVPNLAITDIDVAVKGDALDVVSLTVADAVLEWSEVSGANNYRLLRAQIGGGYEEIYRGLDLLFIESNARIGDIYFYRVQACNGLSCGASSEAVTLRLRRPGLARILFDQSGSSREVVSAGGTVFALSSVTLAWEETPNAQYYYVLRGGAHGDDPFVTVSHPATLDGRADTPLPVFATTYVENLHGDDVRHYRVQACNAFGCGDASNTVALGGGLLGIGDDDNGRTVLSVGVEGGVIVTAAIADSLTDILNTPTNVEVSLCAADSVPRARVKWDVRDTGGDRFYRVSRSRFADSTSAELIVLAPGILGAQPDSGKEIRPGVGEIDDFDYGIQGDLSSVAFYYHVQECSRLQTLDEDNQICSAPAIAITSPVAAFPSCSGDGSVFTPPEPEVNTDLAQVTIRRDLSEVKITATYEVSDRDYLVFDETDAANYRVEYGRDFVVITDGDDEDGKRLTVVDYAGPEYVIALAAFVVKWNATPGAVYYLVTRESKNLYSGESEIATFAVEGETEYADIMAASPDVVNVYRVKACDRENGCGAPSDPLELTAPSPDFSPIVRVRGPVVELVPFDPGYAAVVHVSGALFANRYILSRAPKPASGETAEYTELHEDDEVFAYFDRDVIEGMAYLYRTRACNALACTTSEATLITVTPPEPPTGQSPRPSAMAGINDANNLLQVALEWDAVIGASRYTLTRSTDENDANPAVIYNGGERSHLDDMNVEFGTEYYYRVQACNSAGCAAVSEAGVVLVLAPTAPDGATPNPSIRGGFVGNSPQAILEWGAVEHATNYTLSRSTTDASSGFAVIYKGGATTHTDVSVTVGQMYYYKAQGCNSIGCAGESEVEDLSVPSMPPSGSSSQVRADLSGSSRDGDTSSAVTVVWDAVTPSVDVYVIENNINTGDNFNAIATVNGAMTMHTIDGLPANDFHYYRVRACNRFGDGLVCSQKLNHRLILGGALIGDGTTAAPARFSATACRENTDFARVRWDRPQGRSIRLYLSRFPIDKGAAELLRTSGGNDGSVPAATPPATAVRFDDTLTVGNFHDTIAYYQLQATNGGDFGIPARVNTSPPSSGQYNDLPVVPCPPSP